MKYVVKTTQNSKNDCKECCFKLNCTNPCRLEKGKHYEKVMKKVYNIYNITNGDGVFIQTVTKETTAKMICRKHNKNGERNYMYLESYE